MILFLSFVSSNTSQTFLPLLEILTIKREEKILKRDIQHLGLQDPVQQTNRCFIQTYTNAHNWILLLLPWILGKQCMLLWVLSWAVVLFRSRSVLSLSAESRTRLRRAFWSGCHLGTCQVHILANTLYRMGKTNGKDESRKANDPQGYGR